MHTEPHRILVDGSWVAASGSEGFESRNPATGKHIGTFPMSGWTDVDTMLDAASRAYRWLAEANPDAPADFLERYATRLEERADEIVACAADESALPAHPRLADVELPRTTNQLRQAAKAVRERSWVRPVISSEARIASMLRPIPGAVAVFGPNNFPFAFNGVSGGDFAAAIASGHPVIAKANPGHPLTTMLLAEEASRAAEDTGLHRATVQMLYRTSHDVGARLVADPRIAASAYTGSRAGGLALKTAADAAGKPIYLEMSSINPVVLLPGAWLERGNDLADELVGSMLLGVGQFCTSPGLILSLSKANENILGALAERVGDGPPGTLLDERVPQDLESTRTVWLEAGAHEVVRSEEVGTGCTFPNTLMATDAATFLEHHEGLQTEAFGNMSLFVDVPDLESMRECILRLEGSLTASVYSASDGGDDAAYDVIAPLLAERAGRLLNDKAPTGVAVVSAMNHGGPYPATGHPGFTAVGMPATIARFAMLRSFDNVRPHRLPPELQPSNPLGIPRHVDGQWTADPVDWT
jgi:NADP-dependent aldehyde dehydrogenase